MTKSQQRFAISLLTIRPGQAGGAETYAQNLVRTYASLTKYRFALLANLEIANCYKSVASGAVEVVPLRRFRMHRTKPARAYALGKAAAFPSSLRHEAPNDLAMVHFPIVVPIPRLKVPAVVTLHDTRHHDMPTDFSKAERIYRHVAYDGAARRAQMVVTVSRYSRERLIEKVGLPSNVVTAIPLAVDHSTFKVAPLGQQSTLERKHLSDLGVPLRYIFYPAALWPHKNHDRLLEAISQIPNRDFHLVLTGQTHGGMERLETQVRRRRLSGRVHYLGFTDVSTVAALYRHAIALVFPSLYEGFGVPPLEAMACGCPVVASAVGSIPEVCEEAALMIDPNDPQSIRTGIERVLDDEEVRENLRTKGFLHVKQFTWRRTAQAHIRVYEEAVRRAVER